MSAPSSRVLVEDVVPQVDSVRKDEPRTAVEIWKRRVAASGDGPAFKRYIDGSWVSMSWREADTAAREIAAGLVARGVVPGDRVCLLSQTRLEWVLCDVGILLAGGVTVPIYASNTAEQCEFIVRDAGAKVVIVEDPAQLEKVVGLRDRLFTVTSLVHIEGEAAGDMVTSLDGLRAEGRRWLAAHPDELDTHAETVSPDSMFTIIYTSGTTGNPKGVVLTHENLSSGVCSVIRAMGISSVDDQYLFVPLAHVLGREVEWAPIQLGEVTIFSRGIASIKDDLLQVRPSYMAGVPRIFEKLYAGVQSALAKGSPLKLRLVNWAMGVGRAYSAAQLANRSPGAWLSMRHAVADKLVFSKLRAKLGLDRARFLISGGAPLAGEIAAFFHTVGLLVLEGYGLTETMAAAFLNRMDAPRFGTVGTALDVVETKIAEDGEILMRGPSVFRQYYNNPQATAEAVEPDGWFHSGDIGQLEDGYLRITDRKKDLIVTAGGKKIAPQPLENALKTRSPLVSQVVVYGDKRPYCVALVTLSEEAARRFGNGTGEALSSSPELKAALQKDVDALNKTLAPFETIKRFAILANDFTEAAGEMTPSLKVKRKAVIEKYRPIIEGLYSGGGGD